MPEFDQTIEIAELIIKYARSEISLYDIKKLNKWINESVGNKKLFKRLSNPEYVKKSLENLPDMKELKEKTWERVSASIEYENKIISSYEPKTDNITDAPKIITDVRILNKELLNMVQKDPWLIHQMKPREFEFLVAEIFEKEGYNVTLTQETKDGGKDLFILEKKSIGTFLYYVECKKSAPDKAIGVNIIRELYGTITADRATAGIVVTSSYFSEPAKEFTEKIRYQMSLIDYMHLCEWIKKLS